MAKVFRFGDISAINFIDLSQEDLHRILEIRNDPRISKWMYSQSMISLQTHLDFVNNLKSQSQNIYWLFKNKTDLLGVGSLTRINRVHKNAAVGLYKNPDIPKVGDRILYGLERIAFDSLNLHTLVLEVMEDNLAAIACYERNGFDSIGRLKEFAHIHQNYKDILLYQKINPDSKGV